MDLDDIVESLLVFVDNYKKDDQERCKIELGPGSKVILHDKLYALKNTFTLKLAPILYAPDRSGKDCGVIMS